MRELSLDRLRTLVAIADLGSFAAAARALNLAPPTVSLHVAELEERIGAPLLLRQRGQVRPSGIGETLIVRARRLLVDVDQALDEVRGQVLGRTGRVRLGASTGAIAHLLPQALEQLGCEQPGIDVQVAVLTSQETLARLAENPRVKAVKDATGDVEQGFRRMESTGLEYYSGDDGLNFAWLAHGASGVISVAAHADAHSWRQMIDAVDAGDLASARTLARSLRPLVHAIMGGGQGAFMAKEALHLQGRLPSPALRLPLVRAEEAEVAALREVLAASGLL